MEEIINKVILVTGGANGIGKAIANFLSMNNKVIIIDNDKNIINDNIKDNIDIYVENLTNYVEVAKIIDEIYLKYENIDILINNAGIQTINNILDLGLNEFKKVIEVNLISNFYLTQIVSNRMQSGSTILNVISTHYNRPRIDKVHYDISKSGVATLTKTFALELAKNNITINAIAIGATYTKMNDEFKYDIKKETDALNRVPLKHIFSPNEISQYVYSIIKDFSLSTTGSIFVIDGGRNVNY